MPVTKPSPAISVVMPVYNAARYVAAAIRSILSQTFTDFELIIVDDGSADETPQIIRSFADERIHIIDNGRNLGNYPSRNKGQQAARGKYICVMDADDISLPHRLERQYLFMENNPAVGIAGSGYRVAGEVRDLYREPAHEKLKVMMLCNNYLVHPSQIMRRELLEKYGLRYDESYTYSADYDMLTRAVHYCEIANITEILLEYRLHEGQITQAFRKRQVAFAEDIMLKQLANIKIAANERERVLHLQLMKGMPVDFREKEALRRWIGRIVSANRVEKYYTQQYLEDFLEARMAVQPFFSAKPHRPAATTHAGGERKIDLRDVTFAIPVRIGSDYCQRNLETLLDIIARDYTTNVILLEADLSPAVHLPERQANIRHIFVADSEPVFHHGRYISTLLREAGTPYVAVWTAGAIAVPGQVAQAVAQLQADRAVVSLPHDGPYYAADDFISTLFCKSQHYESLHDNIPVMQPVNGYHSVSGVFVVNKKNYLDAGGHEEALYQDRYKGDAARIKRMETRGLPVFYAPGPVFQLWSPAGQPAYSRDKDMQQRQAFLRTCAGVHNKAIF